MFLTIMIPGKILVLFDAQVLDTSVHCTKKKKQAILISSPKKKLPFSPKAKT